jgi:hypothetical protein
MLTVLVAARTFAGSANASAAAPVKRSLKSSLRISIPSVPRFAGIVTN